jgi:3-hydroxyacyl-CoA dehydrogenase / enoyl-CoA hydratase / 3-hydroxybutyryl-CoA epimerase
MGAGIAYVTASAGIDVVLVDKDQESADKGKSLSDKLISGQIKKGRAKPEAKDQLLARIKATADYKDIEGADLVIEAVFEDRKVKADVIAKAEAVLGDKASSARTPQRFPLPRSPDSPSVPSVSSAFISSRPSNA